MSAENSIGHNDGYIQCLNDLKDFANTELNLNDYKKLRDNFILPNLEKHNNNIGNILHEMYEEYKTRNGK